MTRLLDLLSDPAALALAALVLRAVYAVVSRVVAPHPRARAAVEAVAALLPDVARAALQLVALRTGRPAPRLDALPPDPRDEELLALRARVADLERRTVTLVPDGSETSRVVTRRLRAPESGRAEEAAVVVVLVLTVLVPLAVALAGCGPARDALLAVTPGVPRVAGCDAGAQRCEGAVPVVCSRSGRWWPSLPPDPQGVQRQCPAGCAIDGGTAFCAAAADGGAR